MYRSLKKWGKRGFLGFFFASSLLAQELVAPLKSDSTLADSTQHQAPTLPKEVVLSQDSTKDTTTVVKKSFNHKEQVIVGSAIMASLALILVTMNNYNPK